MTKPVPPGRETGLPPGLYAQYQPEFVIPVSIGPEIRARHPERPLTVEEVLARHAEAEAAREADAAAEAERAGAALEAEAEAAAEAEAEAELEL
jgi:hypothetical protein